MLEDTLHGALRDALHYRVRDICPDPNIRVEVRAGRHFTERLVERFNGHNDMKRVLKNVGDWIDKNYCHVLFEANLKPDQRVEQKIETEDFTLVVVYHDRKCHLRTIWRKE